MEPDCCSGNDAGHCIHGLAPNAGIAHLMRSLKAEASSKTVGVHTLSPGMVLTNLLLEGATLENKQIFNILCEQVCIAMSALWTPVVSQSDSIE